MNKPVRSGTASAKNKSSRLGLPDKAERIVSEISGVADRQEVRQEIHRTNVPRQSQRPAERSNQLRSGKP